MKNMMEFKHIVTLKLKSSVRAELSVQSAEESH